MLMRTSLRAVAILALVALVAAACVRDDGGEVRQIDGENGSSGSAGASGSGSASASGVASVSGSASGSASASGPASASGSASGSPSATGSPSASPSGAGPAAVTAPFGGYAPVSDVSTHARVVLDICEINALLPNDAPIDYAAIETLYEDGGNSVKGDGSIRTIAGFARKDRDEDIWNEYTAYYEDEQWLDTFVMSAIGGTGAFAGEPDLVRRQAIQKGIQNQIMVAWTFHELVAALDKAAAGNIDPASGAPHNWDEGWAFYHGDDPACAPYATADKRGDNFGTGTSVNDAVLAAFTRGVEALAAGDTAIAEAGAEEIKRQVTITYVQATIRYAHKIDAALADGDPDSARISQAEGWAFFRIIEPFVAAVDAEDAFAIAARYDLGAGDPQTGSGDTVQTALESVYDGLGVTPEEIGELG